MTEPTIESVNGGMPEKKEALYTPQDQPRISGSSITRENGDAEAGHVQVSVLASNNFMYRFARRLEELAGAEARGIERVPEWEREERKTSLADYIQMGLIWFSSNLTANNITLGMLGPLTFELGLTDCLLLGTFGSMVGAIGVAYISTFGPMSGNRTLVVGRYTMGWWPSRLWVLLNIVIMLGYGLIDTLIAGQMLSYVHSQGHGLSIVVGTIIAAVISLVICLFGMDVFHFYERYSSFPQLLILFILIGVAGPHFDLSSPGSSAGQPVTSAISANQLSFFFLSVSGPLAWAPAAADYYVSFPTPEVPVALC